MHHLLAHRLATVPLCLNLCGRQLVHLTHRHGNTQRPMKALYLGDLWVPQPPSKARALHIIHPKQFGTSPKRLVLPYLYEEILSGQEEGVSSIRNGFSVWVKTDPQTLVRRHVVDARGLYPAFREAPARRHDPSLLEYRLKTRCPAD